MELWGFEEGDKVIEVNGDDRECWNEAERMR
jgi:hypothetical protein